MAATGINHELETDEIITGFGALEQRVQFRRAPAATNESKHRTVYEWAADQRVWTEPGSAEIRLGMCMLVLPPTPEALLEDLFAIFPEYRAAYDGPIHADAPTYHSVLMAFNPFFGGRSASFSERQLRSFGELVSAAVAAGGSLENAFSTCLLEHLHQIRATRVLRPYLSELARERTHA